MRFPAKLHGRRDNAESSISGRHRTAKTRKIVKCEFEATYWHKINNLRFLPARSNHAPEPFEPGSKPLRTGGEAKLPHPFRAPCRGHSTPHHANLKVPL